MSQSADIRAVCFMFTLDEARVLAEMARALGERTTNNFVRHVCDCVVKQYKPQAAVHVADEALKGAR